MVAAGVFDPPPPHPPMAPVASRLKNARARTGMERFRIARRVRRLNATGRRRNAARTAPLKPPFRLGLMGAGCSIPMMDELVDTVSTVLCGVLLVALKVRLVGVKPQEAEEGSVPQLNVSVPAKPLAGVRVRVEVPVDP